ncbi:MAG TPA: tetratricopeptide repeat protein [Myxococcota bacterium]|nr:tetratricopeptide repeat protein [Myxococcota bacterium]
MTMARRASLALRRLALCACLALLFFAGAADAQSRKKEVDPKTQPQQGALSKRVGEKLSEANDLLQTDQYDAALKIIDELAGRRKLDPLEIAQIHRFRGYILLSKGETEKVPAEFQKSLDQHALDPLAEQQMTYSLAQIYTQLGKHDQALALINTWFEGEEEPRPDAYFLKATILVQQANALEGDAATKKWKEALPPAKAAVDKDPKPRESWVQMLVAIYSNLQDYPNVADTLQRLISMSPQKKQYWTQLAAVQNLIEREAGALATLQLAHTAGLLTDDREYRQLARLLFLREMPYWCAKVIDEGIKGSQVKADADAYKLMSNCLLASREMDLALEPLEKAGELAPDGEMYTLLGQMHLQRDRFQPALEALNKALAKAKPDQRGQIDLLIGVAQLGQNNFDAAERAFNAASADKKVHAAAASYLKFLNDQRQRKQMEEMLKAQAAELEGEAKSGSL